MKLSKEVKIGLIAVLALLVAVWGFNFLKGKNILKPTDEYYIVFDRVDGLIESGNVMYQGYKVGNITSLFFDSQKSGKFRVKIVIEENLNIPLGTVVKIKQVNPLASTADLELVFSNETQYHHPGDTLISGTASGISDIISGIVPKLQESITNIDSVLISINNIMTAATEEKLRKSIASLESSLASLNASLLPGGNLGKSFSNLEAVTGTLKESNDKIAGTINNLSSITADLDSADLETILIRTDSTILALKSMLVKIDEGTGTMGMLVNDPSLYANLDSTAYHLSMLMKDLKDHPKRYVHFSVFGKKDR